jgi:endoglucanase
MASSFLLGVNLAGAEFGSNVPGVFGTDYTYPTHAEIDYYASKGMSVIRLPFLWERVQHAKNGALDAVELGRLDDVVNYTTGKGLKIEIEPHNFGYGFGALIGSAQTPNSAFADVWGKFALHFKSNPDVIFGLMNEPHDQSASVWLGSANAAIAAIRNAGAVSQEILVPGSYWDGAWTWTSADNAAVIGTGVQDSAHNFAFEVHQYLDADGSGTHSGALSATIGVERLTAITQWAEANGKHLFLGEVGVTTDQTSLTALDGMLTYMQQHTGAWEGATYWAGGPWWGNYMFSIEPQNGIDKPQMDILEGHLGSLNHAPVVTVANHSLQISHWSSVATWISYSDADNNPAVQYQFWWGDPSASAAKFWTPSGYQPALNTLTVSATDLANGNAWVGGATAAGSEAIYVRASDGTDWSAWTSFTLTTLPNHAPAVTVNNHSLEINHWSSVKSWISLSDADGDAATQYQFWWGDPSASAAKFWTPAGNQPALNTLTVSAADVAMDNVWLGGATAAGSETIYVRASDGFDWGNWTSFTLTMLPNHAPTVAVNGGPRSQAGSTTATPIATRRRNTSFGTVTAPPALPNSGVPLTGFSRR